MVSLCHGVMVSQCHGVMVSWCHGVVVGLFGAGQEVRWSMCGGHGRNEKLPTAGHIRQMWVLEVIISLANGEHGEKESLGKAFVLAKTFSLPE